MRPIAKKTTRLILCFSVSLCVTAISLAQTKVNDVTTPLHLLQPDYKIPYGAPKVENVKNILKRVFNYLDAVTPAQFVNKQTLQVVNAANVDTNTIVKPGDYRLTAYEWGVTYSAMLLAGEATGDTAYTHYTKERVHFIADAYPTCKALYDKYPKAPNPLRQPVAPHALDDGGAVCAAMIKTLRIKDDANIRVLVNHLIEYITKKEYRLSDGTLARNRPLKNTLWLDDMFMGVPAIAQMGKLTGDTKYYDEAVKQIMQFSKRMFNKNLGIYMHGWVEEMKVHPEFHWARANGWALLTMVEVLDVLPENHPGRKAVIEQLNAHVKGLAAYQSGEGFWHQLLDKSDSYLETSATAIYTYSIAHAVNKGWIDAKAYAPMCLLGWNAVNTKVNSNGQVEGTCVGTGMAFDPAFYYYRPVNTYAAHSYGPVILAGAEVINLLNKYSFEINDSSLQLKDKK